jgi:hypothetical protein
MTDHPGRACEIPLVRAEPVDDFDFDLDNTNEPVVSCPTCPTCSARRGYTVPGGCLHCPDCGETWQDPDYLDLT